MDTDPSSMNALLDLYRFALRSGNRPLAARLSAVLSRDAALAAEVDDSLRELPRGPARWSPGAERAVLRTINRLSALPL